MKDLYSFIIADDHPLFRKALIKVLQGSELVGKVSEAANGNEVLQILKNEHADIVFLDYSMPGMNGFDTATLIVEDFPTTEIIVLTQYDEIAVILNFFKLGVKGFLTKNADEKEIAEAIRTVIDGGSYYHSRFEEAIGRWLGTGLAKNVPTIKFSEKELKMMILISKGKTSSEISVEMGSNLRTVESYRSRIYKNLNVKNSTELVHYLYQNGIV